MFVEPAGASVPRVDMYALSGPGKPNRSEPSGKIGQRLLSWTESVMVGYFVSVGMPADSTISFGEKIFGCR